MGPLEFVAVAFPGNRFNGQILSSLKRAVDNGTIRIIDLEFVKRDGNGAVTSHELTELGDDEAALFDPLVGDITGLLSPADVDKVGAALENDSSAALLVFEHVWATDLQQAILDANGKLLAQERIPRADAEAALAAAASSDQLAG
jgi:Family of unknown function (DUF6325)